MVNPICVQNLSMRQTSAMVTITQIAFQVYDGSVYCLISLTSNELPLAETSIIMH